MFLFVKLNKSLLKKGIKNIKQEMKISAISYIITKNFLLIIFKNLIFIKNTYYSQFNDKQSKFITKIK